MTSLLSHMEQESPGSEHDTSRLSMPWQGSAPLTEYCLLLLEIGSEALGGQAQCHVPCAQRIIDALPATMALRGCQLVQAFVLLPQLGQEDGCEVC